MDKEAKVSEFIFIVIAQLKKVILSSSPRSICASNGKKGPDIANSDNMNVNDDVKSSSGDHKESYYGFQVGGYHGGARGVMIIVTGYGHGNTSSIPGQDWLHFT